MIKKVDQEDGNIPLDPEKICQCTLSSHYIYALLVYHAYLCQCRNLKIESNDYKKSRIINVN